MESENKDSGIKDLPDVLVKFKYPDVRPKKYGRYLVVRKDGKQHLETWNGTGWAYNNNVIVWFYDQNTESVENIDKLKYKFLMKFTEDDKDGTFMIPNINPDDLFNWFLSNLSGYPSNANEQK